MSTRVWVLGAVLLVGVGGGCGPGTPEYFRATGTVTYKGAPVEGALVSFVYADGNVATGNTDAQGKFAVDAVAGKAKVSVSKATGGIAAAPDVQNMTPTEAMAKMHAGAKSKQEMQGGGATKTSDLPAKYANPTTSGFEADVKAGGTNDFTFALTD